MCKTLMKTKFPFKADHLEMLKESASSAAANAATTATEVALENATTRIKLDVVCLAIRSLSL